MTCSNATLGRATNSPRAANSQGPFPSPNPRVRSTQASEGNLSGVMYQRTELRPSPAILAAGMLARCNAGLL